MPPNTPGYSRINGLPPVPTLIPTPEPTALPTPEPTPVPTMDNMCCLTTNYASVYWQGCHDAADPNLGNISFIRSFTHTQHVSLTYCTNAGSITSCDNCAAYACLDWLPGSTDMVEREKVYYSHTLDSVYFGVGSFGSDKGFSLPLFHSLWTFPFSSGISHALGQGGLCYRITTNTLDRDIIMQVVTTDSDDGNVHLMSADGGKVCAF